MAFFLGTVFNENKNKLFENFNLKTLVYPSYDASVGCFANVCWFLWCSTLDIVG